MYQELTSKGICSTCSHKSECLFCEKNRQAKKIVWYCEAFDDSALEINSEKIFSSIPFADIPNLKIKSLIPGWES